MNKPSERIPVTPAVLTWARESISLDPEAAAKRLGVSPKTLIAWEAGELSPTINQLRVAAEKYKRPLGVLLLSTPPLDFDAMRDFRRHGLAQAPWSPDLHGEFRRALDQREVFLELAETTPDSVPATVRPPRVVQQLDPETVGTRLRDYVALTTTVQSRWRDQYQALNFLIDNLESKGILVIHVKGVSVDEMRAFSISEWPYPVIALNGADYPRGRLFSLMHELTHLALNDVGLCDLHENRRRRREHASSDNTLEHFCNQVAAAALMPKNEVLALQKVHRAESSYNWSLDDLEPLAGRFGVSQEAFLLRLVSLRKATWDTYWQRHAELQQQYEAAALTRREQRRAKKGGPDFYRTKARDIGHGYANAVLDAFGSKSLSARDVSDFLDIKFGQLERLQAELR